MSTASSPRLPHEPREMSAELAALSASITRRDFLRACAVTGLGLDFGFQHQRAEATVLCPADGKASGENLMVGLDIGTSKVCAVVAERRPGGTIKILGVGQAPSLSVREGGIVDFEAASGSVREALADAEARSDVMIRSVVLAVTGAKLAPGDDGPAWQDIFEREEICYADRGDGILRRVRLPESKGTRGWQVVWGAGTRILNSIRCLNDLGVEVERIVYAPVATAAAVLNAKQKQLGALVIDMGFGTTDYAVYSGGALVQSDCFPIGSVRVADDVAREMRIPRWQTEMLKIEERLLRRDAVPEQRVATLRKQREELPAIVRYRIEQAFNLVKCRLVNTGVRLDSLLAGAHLTGGCALQAGICELAEEIFGIPARRARLKGISTVADALENPRFSCALGLVKLAIVGNNRNHDYRQYRL